MAKKKTGTLRKKKPKKKNSSDSPRCGLCGKSGKLIKTECCGQWICDDEDKYVLFSYARNGDSERAIGVRPTQLTDIIKGSSLPLTLV